MKLKLLTFNIRCDTSLDGENAWPYRRLLVNGLIHAQGADVVALQEVLPHQREELQLACPDYRFFGRGRNTDGGGEQCAIAVKADWIALDEGTFWLSNEPDNPGTIGWDAMLPRICTWVRLRGQDQEFAIFNTHFDHFGIVALEMSAELILGKMHSLGVPCILAGDLNSAPGSSAVRILKQELLDCYAFKKPTCQKGTYHEFGQIDHHPRIDYLMSDTHWEVGDCEILDQIEGPYPSDHFPVTGNLALLHKMGP